MRWVRLILTTLLVTTAVIAVVIGLDWAWHKTPGSAPVAAVIGDPRVQLDVKLPPTPARVPIYEVGSPITATAVEKILGGKAAVRDGWITWTGSRRIGVLAAMRSINPGIPWHTQGNSLGPATQGVRVRTAGLSSAFTGTAVATNSFGDFATNGQNLVALSIPAHRIHKVGTIQVIPATVALLDVRHHRDTTRLATDTVPLLPQRLAGATVSAVEPISDVWLAQAADPLNPSRSKPVWVFSPIAESDAQR